MANPLQWKEGEGYDIHLLRGGPESKKLIDALDLDSSQTADTRFIRHLEGGVNNHGVDLNASTGILRALMHPDPNWPRVNNFLLSALFAGPGGTQETKIRIHVHDSVKDIWLTPSTLTIHEGAADECRFTVLARFNDDVVGDITDWSQLSYKSVDVDVVTHADSTDVLVSPRGVLKAVTPGKSAEITVTLTLPPPLLPPPLTSLTSAPAKALAKASWVNVATNAKVQFVAGPVYPSSHSVKSVVENATNILFVAEGFRQHQRGDFNNLVHIIVEELRTKDYLLPFRLLKDSINYWSVFIPSEEEGVSLLGDYTYETVHFTGELVPLPRQPLASATEWSFTEMIHEVGLPVLQEVETPWLPDHVRRWQKLYGAKVTEGRTRKFYGVWTSLAFRSPLNERDSAFGMAISDRPRASQGERQANSLRCDFRRTSEANILTFVQSLTYAGHPIGSTWQVGGKDFGLVSFVCLSDRDAGIQRRGRGYFTASLGLNRRADLRPVPGRGLDIKTAMPEKHSRTVFASVWAHECSHAFGLWDEYGDGQGTELTDSAAVAPHPNVLAKSSITTTTTNPATGTKTTVFDKTKEIKWLWPRISKAGVVNVQVDIINDKVLSPEKCDQNGNPNLNGSFLLVRLRKGPREPFVKGDVVRMRGSVVQSGNSLRWIPPSSDPIAAFPLVVEIPGNDKIILGHMNPILPQLGYMDPIGPQLDPIMFKSVKQCSLIGPRIVAGNESKLVAEPIMKHIASKGPLTAEPGFDPALCFRALSPYSVMVPTNLPSLSSTPRTSAADIIGIYEGGSYHDCGVFRPAGRCKMRAAYEKTIPFCHVCRYLLVDWVDPTKHGKLDTLYPEVR